MMDPQRDCFVPTMTDKKKKEKKKRKKKALLHSHGYLMNPRRDD